MNNLISLFILAVVQGITEWLPVSSSGHMIIISKIIGYNLDLFSAVALEFGTLMAVFAYFGRDISDIVRDFLRCKFDSENGRLGIKLIIASIPAAIFGLLLNDFFESSINNLWLLVFGWVITILILLIGSADTGLIRKSLSNLSYKNALFIGLAQVLSLFRGISRGGSTIVSGLVSGLNEKDAVKFSFLLSIPVILGANIIEIGSNSLPSSLIWATLAAFVAGLFFIHFSFKYILNSRKNFRWIALYLLCLVIAVSFYLLLS